MDKPNPAIVWATGILAIALFGGIVLWEGTFFIEKHEGDTLHLIDILERLRLDQDIHRDFMTPIGILAFVPMVWARDLGLGLGQSIFAAQIFVAALLLPAAVWVGVSRMSKGGAPAFVTVIVVFCTALVHGEDQITPSISMHYNRWAWAVAFIAIALVVLPAAHRYNPTLDGVFIGTLMAILAMTKMTYFVALAPVIGVGMLLQRQKTAITWAIPAGLAVALAITLWQGPDIWSGYISDLLTVANSDSRQRPGNTFGAVIGAPAGIGCSLAVVMAVILLRQGRRYEQGAILLLLTPSFFYITFQNYGNDPQWIILLPFLLWPLRPQEPLRNGFGWDIGQALIVLIAISLAFGATSFLNMAYSPFRHLKISAKDTTEMVPGYPDLRLPNQRAYSADAGVVLLDNGAPYARYANVNEMPPHASINGETLAHCELTLGLKAYFEAMADDLETEGYGGSKVFIADLLGSIWLYGSFPVLQGSAPWHYGGLPGWDDATHLAVPKCANSVRSRRSILEQIEESGVALREVWRGDTLILFERRKE
jgi:hypothetical protein